MTEEKRKADRRAEAHDIFQGVITGAENIGDLEVLRTEIRGEQAELGMRRRVTLEQNCSRRIEALRRVA